MIDNWDWLTIGQAGGYWWDFDTTTCSLWLQMRKMAWRHVVHLYIQSMTWNRFLPLVHYCWHTSMTSLSLMSHAALSCVRVPTLLSTGVSPCPDTLGSLHSLIIAWFSNRIFTLPLCALLSRTIWKSEETTHSSFPMKLYIYSRKWSHVKSKRMWNNLICSSSQIYWC